MQEKDWRKRISYRSDLVARVTHLTGRKATSDEDAFDILWKIVTEKKLIASGNEGFILGSKKAVCFQEVPLSSLAENLLFEENAVEKHGTSPRYRGFGIRINKGNFYKSGGRPVFYELKDELAQWLPENEHWRIVITPAIK